MIVGYQMGQAAAACAGDKRAALQHLGEARRAAAESGIPVRVPFSAARRTSSAATCSRSAATGPWRRMRPALDAKTARNLSRDDLAVVIGLSAETPRLAVTPATVRQAGRARPVRGQGPEAQRLPRADRSRPDDQAGMDKGRATAIARGSIRKWMRGGGHVHPEVRAAAAGAEAEELKAQARAHAHASHLG